MFYSPLRYPGGKNKLAAFLARICIDNQITGHYVEPYAGGASVALFLLLEGFVEKITINDIDRSIYAFWYSALYRSDELIKLIFETEITVEQWYKQKEVQKKKKHVDILELGFSTLYLNRTNRSGILRSGCIGGLEQKGEYLIDCRFNKQDIINRIIKIRDKKERIRLFKWDAIRLIDKIENEAENTNTIFYFDPPYYLKGDSLYVNHCKHKDHEVVGNRIKRIRNLKWIVSYDNVPEIRSIYSGFYTKEYSFKHTAFKPVTGQEALFFSQNLDLPQVQNWNPLQFRFNRKTSSIKYKQSVRKSV
ncbi:MAG: DNA methyltransferase [Marinilabiliales bacterium]|nr:MAG: DNA methyltransferase [Marinilabiliales bacterium]